MKKQAVQNAFDHYKEKLYELALEMDDYETHSPQIEALKPYEIPSSENSKESKFDDKHDFV